VERLRASFHRFDRLRIDHFRGFSAYWEIPASEPTAVKGRWLDGPGDALFGQVISALGPLPIIAEDLGVITDDVTRLRRRFGFPGMRVAQFGFDEEPDTAIHNPANYPEDVVAYTGTHDNDTAVGWFWGNNHRHDRRRLRKHRRQLLRDVGTKGDEINWDLIRLVMGSAAALTVTPVQDLLGLGSVARMNTPGVEENNWTWRMTEGALNEEVATRMAALTAETGRG
jgi:4-alpha-glucanotransferase